MTPNESVFALHCGRTGRAHPGIFCTNKPLYKNVLVYQLPLRVLLL